MITEEFIPIDNETPEASIQQEEVEFVSPHARIKNYISEVIPNDLSLLNYEERVSFSSLVMKRVVEEGEGLCATPGSVIRCKYN